MEPSRAAENLQVIRTLMERSALYRRALAPVMLVSGCVGSFCAIAGHAGSFLSIRSFTLLWTAAAGVALISALLFIRRQALKDAEPFWSLPTRRVTFSLLPPFFLGLMTAIGGLLHGPQFPIWLLVAVWLGAYGCGLHAAAFVLARGVRLLGWGFIAGASTVLLGAPLCPWLQSIASAHTLMGCFFGAAHLVGGVYLYFTERKQLP